jgi:multidrug efflux pump subunit AcrB
MIDFFLRKKILVTLLTIFIVAAGITMLTQIKRSTYPSVEFDILKVTTTYPGASAEDVEINVTKKIEDEIKTVRDIDKMRSNSLENISIVYVWVDPNADDSDLVKDDIRRAVQRVSDLPLAVTERPVIDELKASNVVVIELAVSGDVAEKKLRKIAKDLEEDINEVPGVGSVEFVGYRKREVKIQVDADLIKSHYVGLNEVVRAIGDRNIRTSAGTLESYTDEKKIVTFAEFSDPIDVKKVIVRKNFDGKQLKLEEIASITDSFEDYVVIPKTNQKKSINLLVRSQTNADIIDISNAIKTLVKKTQQVVPQGIDIDIVIDFSIYTKSLLNIVTNNALYGFILVLIVLLFFLDRYTALWTAAGIPISFLGALVFFPVFGVDINFISLITLVVVLGMIVDDAIVVAENVNRYREKGFGPFEAAAKGAKEVMWPVTATIATTIIAFMSAYFMTGITGKFVRQIPIVVSLTLIMSLIECLFILPSHIANSPLRQAKKQMWFEKIKGIYHVIIYQVVRQRIVALIGFALFLGVAILLSVTTLKVNLFPYDDVDLFYIVAELPKGTSLDETAKRLHDIEKIVDVLPRSAMVNYTTTIGHHDRDVYGATAGLRHNWGMVSVYLKPAADREENSDDVMLLVTQKIKELKGFERIFLDKFNDGPPVGKPITVTFVSDDDVLRRQVAQEAYGYISKIPGVINLESSDKKGKEELRLKPDYELMAKLGITSRMLADTIRLAYSGVVVTSMTREGEEIDFRVELKPHQKSDLDVLKSLQVVNNQGRLIDLGNFTKLEPSEGYENFKHYNGRRSITISGDVDEKLITSLEVNKKIAEAFQQKVDGQPGLKLIFGGEEQATQESMQSFMIAFVYALIAIYFLLVILFDSFLQPLIIVAVIPFGIAGMIYTFFITGHPISFIGGIGALGLIGVMVNDSLVMVSYLNRLRVTNKGLTMEALANGCLARLRPVILTTITTVVGLLPTLMGWGGYEPFIIPLVLALAGGLVFATPITLLLVPILYSFGVKKEGVGLGL